MRLDRSTAPLCGAISLLVVVWVLATAEAVRAGDQPPELTGKAAELFTQGRNYYRQEKYEKAAETLRRAYREFEHPLLLYNVALADWRAGAYDRALREARRAKQGDVGERISPRLSGMIRGLEARQRADELSERLETSSIPDPGSSGRTEPKRGLSTVGWTGIGIGGLGGVAFAGAIWMDRRIQADERAFRRARRSPNRDRYESLKSRIVRRQRAGLILLGSGVVLTGTGAYLLGSDLWGGDDAAAASAGSSDSRPRARTPSFGVGIRGRGVSLWLSWF